CGGGFLCRYALRVQMLMTCGQENGTYEQRNKTQRSSGRPEGVPGMMAAHLGSERLDETVH
ncbi:MAG TPA: hypothetical protein VII58_06815, partial [Acidobacteriaceae bacterium]